MKNEKNLIVIYINKKNEIEKINISKKNNITKNFLIEILKIIFIKKK